MARWLGWYFATGSCTNAFFLRWLNTRLLLPKMARRLQTPWTFNPFICARCCTKLQWNRSHIKYERITIQLERRNFSAFRLSLVPVFSIVFFPYFSRFQMIPVKTESCNSSEDDEQSCKDGHGIVWDITHCFYVLLKSVTLTENPAVIFQMFKRITEYLPHKSPLRFKIEWKKCS